MNLEGHRLLVATTNPGKLREIASLLAGLEFRLMTLADLPPINPPGETGRTFAENARLKAHYYARATGFLTVAEDSGLEIDALGGAPGVESARFGGETLGYPDKFALIYEQLRAKKAMESPARFVCAIALVMPPAPSPLTLGPQPSIPPALLFEATGTVEGRIAPEPRGTGGFGYDPILFFPPFGATLAEAGERKSAVSHRGAAFRALRSFLEQS